MMGLIRLASGVAAIDAGTRLVGLMLKDLPAGIEAMDPDAEYLAPYEGYPATVSYAFAADVVLSDANDRYGLAALSGFGRAAFAGAPNDLVVPEESARGGLVGTPPTWTLSCDHFSYLDQPQVQELLTSIVGTWSAPPGRDIEASRAAAARVWMERWPPGRRR
jgi:hypothetical protein